MIAKKRMFKLLIVLSLFLVFGALASEGVNLPRCQNAVSTFLTVPTKHTFSVLSGYKDSDCWPVIGSSNFRLNKLIHSVEKGNQWAAQYLVNHLKNLDGGNLEDSLIALGQFGDRYMERLLSFEKKGQLSKQGLADALTMLPLSLSDNLHAQLDLLRTRRIRVVRVTRSDLLKQREFALKEIDNFMAEIKSKGEH